MVFSYIWTRNQDYRFAYQAKLADRTCSSTTYHQVGSPVGSTHIADEVHNLKVLYWLMLCQGVHYGFVVVFTSLPYYLHVSILYHVEMVDDTFVYSSCSKTSAYYEDSLLGWFESESLACFFFCYVSLKNILSYRVTCHDNLVGREESVHTFIGHTYLACLLCQQLVGYASI